MEYYLNNGENDWHLNLARAVMPNVDWPQAGPNQPMQQDIGDQTGLVSQPPHQDVRPRNPAAPASQSNAGTHNRRETMGHEHASGRTEGTMNADVQQWLKDAGITERTSRVLEDNGFLTKRSICLIQHSDIQNMYVRPLAQQRLLQDLISRGSGAAAPPVPQDQHPPCPELGTTANPPPSRPRSSQTN